MTVKERLIKFLKTKKISQASFANTIGVSTGYVNAIRVSIQPDKINSIAINYPDLNIDWLLTGNGEMLKTLTINNYDDNLYLVSEDISTPYLESKTTRIKYFKLPNDKYIMRVPYIPIYAYAKYIDEIRDVEEWNNDSYIDFPVDQIYHGNYNAFEIKGDSMDDDSKRSLSHGDIVNARELNREFWKSKLHTDKFPNWIIVLDNTIICKQIINQDVEKGIITCHSLNPSPEYMDFDISLNDVRKLFNIVQKTSTSF